MLSVSVHHMYASSVHCGLKCRDDIELLLFATVGVRPQLTVSKCDVCRQVIMLRGGIK